MEIFVWTFAIFYALQIVFGVVFIASDKQTINLSKEQMAYKVVVKFAVFTWAVYLLSRG